MNDPKLIEVPPVVLSYHERRAYRASGRLEVGGLLIALTGGFLAAIVSAIVVWGWMAFVEKGMIFGVIVPVLGQGVIVGMALFFLFQWTKLRNAPLALGIGLLCALFSAMCFQGAVYVDAVHVTVKRVRLDLIDQGVAPDSQKAKFYNAAIAKPFDFYDRYILLPKTRHSGFPGFLRLRWDHVGGWISFQVLALTITAGIMGWQASNRPFCETCGVWYAESFTAVAMGGKWADSLTQAVSADDPNQVLAVLQGAADSPNSSVTRVRCEVCRCRKCAGCLAKIFLGGQGKNQDKTKTIMPLHRVSAETVSALKTEITSSVVDA